MKDETALLRLLDILGADNLKEKVPEVVKSTNNNKKNLNKFVPITEDELAYFRSAQGVLYFLQAPELFTLKTCPHCNSEFLVSRQFVGYCSYTCIAKSLEELGIRFSQYNEEGDIEISQEWLDRNYGGNEPIWIKNLDTIRKLIGVLEKESA